MDQSSRNPIVKSICITVLSLAFICLANSARAQTVCNHLSLDYNAGQWYYALGVTNNSLEESDWTIEINDANYMLDGNQFNNSNGIQLTVETTTNTNGTYNHHITPDQPIGAYEYLSFVYNGSLSSSNNNFDATTTINCTLNYAPLCANLVFNYFNESQYSFGFSIQNNNSIDYYPYEIYIDDATYHLDSLQLKYRGFDFFETDNGNGTYDYYFLAQDPIKGYSSSPKVKTNQNLGPNVSSNGIIIQCGNDIVSSGFTGGLESHGALATKIALRNFKRALGINNEIISRNNNTIISEFAPKHILSGDNLVEASPTDLVGLTAAEIVWAGDYHINSNRFASVFGTKTSEEVYDHTKVICDRVKGSELLEVELVNIGGYENILSIIKRPDQSIEYAISFSLAYKDYGDFTMASYWAEDEYPDSPNFLNYQVWTNSKAKSIAAVQQIIDNIVTVKGHKLRQAITAPVAPKLFARKAHYRLGALHLELNNKLTESKTVQISGTLNTKEVNGEVISFNEELDIIPGQTSLKLEIPYGNIFDGQLSLKSGDNQKDVIYLADGSWGLEYQKHATTVHDYEILAETRIEKDDEYLVERGISVSGITDNYISIFKQLKPGGLPVDLSNYNTLSFDSEREGVYEVTLLTHGNTDPSQNLSYTLETVGASSVDIPFALFSNDADSQLNPSIITTIYIAFIEANNNRTDFDFSIENVRFRNDETSNLGIDPVKLNLYPNPSNGIINLTHKFKENSEVTITVYDTKGTLVKQEITKAFKGFQNFELRMDNNVPGVYIITLQTNDGVYTNSVLISK